MVARWRLGRFTRNAERPSMLSQELGEPKAATRAASLRQRRGWSSTLEDPDALLAG